MCFAVLGVCKIMKTCSAFMSTSMDVASGGIIVEYCSHHIGHNLDIGHLRLSQELRSEIAGLLHQGVTVDKVMDTIRQRISGVTLQLDNLLCRSVVFVE